jgi:hypothetical protein
MTEGACNILIPWGGHASWHELKYCLRSIEKHIPNARVTIMSDEHIEWVKNVELVVMPRFYPNESEYRMFENYWCTLYKIYKYSESNTGKFLYVHDDMLFIKQVDPQIFHYVALENVEQRDLERRKDRHGRTIKAAISLLQPVGVDLWNAECHLPRLFEANKAYQLFDIFYILKQPTPPDFSTLYYNYFYDKPDKVLSDGNDIRASFCMEESDDSGSYIVCKKAEIYDACSDKTILHYNDKGINFCPWGHYILREVIEELFPNPSMYEQV